MPKRRRGPDAMMAQLLLEEEKEEGKQKKAKGKQAKAKANLKGDGKKEEEVV
jgi:hypothetical protein